MRKSTKIITPVMAIALVLTSMLVAIYAATLGGAIINANVSWVAQAGVNFEFWAESTGGDKESSIEKKTVLPTTTNVEAQIIGDLSCNFTDKLDDGVNNPGVITFKYYVKNLGANNLNIKVTKTPAKADESGTSGADHKPKVELASNVAGTSTLNDVLGSAGYNLAQNQTFEYSVVLSLASGGTGDINADTSIDTKFDASVVFLFNVGSGTSVAEGTISTNVDGVATSVSSETVVGQTVRSYLETLQNGNYISGWFYDSKLTKVVSEETLNEVISKKTNLTLYSKTASIAGLKFTLSDDGNSYLVEAGSNTSVSGEVVIPNMYNGKPVSGFPSSNVTPAFKKSANITSVILPSSITTIANFAFYGCSELKNVTIPNSVTNIENYAFHECGALTSMEIPSSVTTIKSFAFAYCDGLTNIVISDGVTSIGPSAFTECYELKSVVIPDSVTSIGYSAFYGCIALNNLTIGNGVKTIGSSAFTACALTSIEVPSSVVSIGGGAFSGCSGLTSIKVASGNTKYDSRNNCNAIIETSSNTLIAGCVNTVIPNTVISIGDEAFAYYDNLTSIEIPDSVTSIGNRAFQSCIGLSKIFIPKSIVTISSSQSDVCSPFFYCSSSLQIYCEVDSKPSGWSEYWNCRTERSDPLNVTWSTTREQFNAL